MAGRRVKPSIKRCTRPPSWSTATISSGVRTALISRTSSLSCATFSKLRRNRITPPTAGSSRRCFSSSVRRKALTSAITGPRGMMGRVILSFRSQGGCVSRRFESVLHFQTASEYTAGRLKQRLIKISARHSYFSALKSMRPTPRLLRQNPAVPIWQNPKPDNPRRPPQPPSARKAVAR